LPVDGIRQPGPPHVFKHSDDTLAKLPTEAELEDRARDLRNCGNSALPATSQRSIYYPVKPTGAAV